MESNQLIRVVLKLCHVAKGDDVVGKWSTGAYDVLDDLFWR